MKSFLKKYWLALLVVAAAAVVLWRLWPKAQKTVRKITFTDLPIISGGSIVDDGFSGGPGAAGGDDDDLDALINGAIADYDR